MINTVHNSKHFKCHWKFMLLNINNSGLNSKCLTSHPDTCVPSLLHTDVMVLIRMYREKAILLRIIHAFKYDLKMAYILEMNSSIRKTNKPHRNHYVSFLYSYYPYFLFIPWANIYVYRSPGIWAHWWCNND